MLKNKSRSSIFYSYLEISIAIIYCIKQHNMFQELYLYLCTEKRNNTFLKIQGEVFLCVFRWQFYDDIFIQLFLNCSHI